jgi:hypothetical protein
VACNQRLVDACYLWAFAALTASPGARRCYDAHRARGATHHQALRALGNWLVGILHGCLAHRVAYQEQVASPAAEPWPELTLQTNRVASQGRCKRLGVQAPR